MFSGLIKLNCIPTTYLGPPDMVGHVSSVQYSHIVPYNRFILLKKSTTKKFKKIQKLTIIYQRFSSENSLYKYGYEKLLKFDS